VKRWYIVVNEGTIDTAVDNMEQQNGVSVSEYFSTSTQKETPPPTTSLEEMLKY